MRSIILCCLCLINCAHDIRIETPEQLPIQQHSNPIVLNQKHYISPIDLHIEVEKLQLNFLKFSEDLNNLQYWYMGDFFTRTRDFINHLIMKMNDATSIEEMLYYRNLYFDTLNIFKDSQEWFDGKRLDLRRVEERFKTGP